MHSSPTQDGESYREQTMRARPSPSFLGHSQHSHPAQCHPFAATLRDISQIWALDLSEGGKVACHLFVNGALSCKSYQQILHLPPWAGQTPGWEGGSSPLMPLPAAQSSGQVCQHHILLQNMLSPAFHLHWSIKQLLTASFQLNC